MEYIQQFNVKGLWGRLNLSWTHLNQDVNILVGINGCGKTTLLNLIYDYYKGIKQKKGFVTEISGNEIDVPIEIVRSFDIPSKTKKKSESNLLSDLNGVIMQNSEGTSFFDYRMQMLNYPEKRERIQQRIDKFFSLVNSLYKETGKCIDIDKINNKLVFKIKDSASRLTTEDSCYLTTSDGEHLTAGDVTILLEQLSSGEKQMLLILTMAFLQDESPSVFLLDEPEISLHISWQSKLIDAIKTLNPNCQLILTTHSPSIFAKGWQDKIVYMDDLMVKGE
ncbi:MAG: AAA family ATPase [Bacteroidaceae bacterium]|nr:AAA family ATPase [Bacteroidaceae bacterium]